MASPPRRSTSSEPPTPGRSAPRLSEPTAPVKDEFTRNLWYRPTAWSASAAPPTTGRLRSSLSDPYYAIASGWELPDQEETKDDDNGG
eukprot:664520-Prymnesium_polylepis.1